MKKIKTALLSYGMSGKVFHAPFVQLHPGFELMGAWERSKQVIRQDYPEVTSYKSLEAVLEDESIELVVVNTPTSTHYDFAKKALEYGKHLVVEKAFTTTTQEAEVLRDLAKSKDLKLTVFQNRRWDSDFKTVKQVLDQGLIGDVVEATIAFQRYKPELSPKLHKEVPSPGAGIVKDLGPHCLDQALCLFGMPQAVFADIGFTRPGSQVDDYFDILLSYPHLRVHVKGGYFFREPTPSFAFHGTLGSFLKSRADVQETQLQNGMKPNETGYGIEPEIEHGLLHTMKDGNIFRGPIETLPGNYLDFYEQVYQSIVKDDPEPVTAQDGVNVMQVIDAAFESHRLGKVVELG